MDGGRGVGTFRSVRYWPGSTGADLQVGTRMLQQVSAVGSNAGRRGVLSGLCCDACKPHCLVGELRPPLPGSAPVFASASAQWEVIYCNIVVEQYEELLKSASVDAWYRT